MVVMVFVVHMLDD